PIHRSVALHLVGRIALLVEVLAVLVLDRRRIAGTIGAGDGGAGDNRAGKQDDSHNGLHGRFLALVASNHRLIAASAIPGREGPGIGRWQRLSPVFGSVYRRPIEVIAATRTP